MWYNTPGQATVGALSTLTPADATKEWSHKPRGVAALRGLLANSDGL